MLEKYFSKIPAGPKPEEMTTIEPKQFAEKSVVIREQTQPFYLEGYHRPDYRDPDDAVYDAISDIMSNGRVSRLYRSLVEQQQIAAEAEGFSPFPAISILACSRSMRCRCRGTRRRRCATPSTKRLTS
jgi:predicted Zn-dependent peptidase